MTHPGGRVLVFAKAPEPGTVKTRLIPTLGAEGAARLYADLVERTVATACTAGAAELWCSPHCDDPFIQRLTQRWSLECVAQQGDDLGERMAHAFEVALSQTEHAVLIGSDCPGFAAHYIQQALQSLHEGNDAVLGPAEDGGYVLIGLRRLHRSIFDGVSWGEDTVLDDTRHRLRTLGWRWRELKPLWDVDRPEDLNRPWPEFPHATT